jgi:muramoyltetrapeptide carboxypeptidase
MSQAPSRPRLKPPALRSGDTVGIVAPASNIKRELLAAGCACLRQKGYNPIYLDSILDQDLYFAGSVERRRKELEYMFEREDVRAILCARGGYGSNYLPPVLTPSKIVAHPKIFVGYSDISTLGTCFCDNLPMVTFHGPMVTKDFAIANGVDWPSWDAAVGGAREWEITDHGARPLVEGSAEGIFYGGCLSLLVASIGTPHDIHTDGTILFLEDVGTKPYQIDRMLMHLKLAGRLDNVRGILFGAMTDCAQHPEQPYTLEEVVRRIVEPLRIPVAFGLRSGHVEERNLTLPIGIRASLQVKDEVKLRFLEAATQA